MGNGAVDASSARTISAAFWGRSACAASPRAPHDERGKANRQGWATRREGLGRLNDMRRKQGRSRGREKRRAVR